LHQEVINITKRLKEKFIDKSHDANEITLFMCGGSEHDQDKFRRDVGAELGRISSKSKYNYSVYYPEDMFTELVHGHQRRDLLSLENLLGDSVHCVVILLQSPGTFTELGAFSNHRKLKNKLIVVIDPKYRLSSSFVSRGPVRHLQTRTRSKVLYSSMDYDNLEVLARELVESARYIAKHSAPIHDLSNAVSSYVFYLSLIYIFDPIRKETIFSILRSLVKGKKKFDIVGTVAETVINGLINERKAACISGSLSITPKGIDNLVYNSNTWARSDFTSHSLTSMRLEALNLMLRKKYSRIWAE